MIITDIFLMNFLLLNDNFKLRLLHKFGAISQYKAKHVYPNNYEAVLILPS